MALLLVNNLIIINKSKNNDHLITVDDLFIFVILFNILVTKLDNFLLIIHRLFNILFFTINS